MVVFIKRFNISSCQKTISETKCYLSTTTERQTYFRRYIGAKNHNFNIPLILNKYNIMIVVQKIKFMQEFTFSINVECLHSNLRAKAKLLMHNFARVFVAYKEF